MKIRNLCLTAMLLSLMACGAFIREQTLSIALLNEDYSEQILYGDNSGVLFMEDNLFAQSGGVLPDGVFLYDDGQILGTPTTLGLHTFEAQIYHIYEDDDGYENETIEDTKTLDLFVTEPSSNDDCPSPDDETTTSTHLCVGSGFLDSLAEDESFTLDVTYFVDFAQAHNHKIHKLVFTIFYDNDNFALDEKDLNENILREAATDVGGTVNFSDEPGELQVTLTSGENDVFRFSGRLLDLPVYARHNLDPNSFTFDVRIDKIESHDATVPLPDAVAVDGTVTVE